MLEAINTALPVVFIVITSCLFITALVILVPWRNMYKDALYYTVRAILFTWFMVHRSNKALRRFWGRTYSYKPSARQLNKDEHLYDWEG